MRKYILFVDSDEENIRNMKREFAPMENEWEMYFASTSDYAIKILAEEKVDTIVTDLNMPETDGPRLLSMAKEGYPKTVRIIMTEKDTEQDKLLRSAQVAHQFVTKPLGLDEFKQRMERTFRLRSHLENEKLQKMIGGIGALPSLPEVYLKLEEAFNNPDISIREIADLISSDMTMTAKILQLVNSPIFGMPVKVNDIVQAVNFLGINVLKNLTLYVKVFATYGIAIDKNFPMEELWQHSLKVGKAARAIAKHRGMDKRHREEAYVAGILHDVGKLIMLTMPEYYPAVLKLIKENNMSYFEAEYDLYKTTHAEAGAYLLSVWGLSDNITEAVAYHHRPSRAKAGSFSVLSAVHLANSIVRMVPVLDFAYIKNINIESELYEFVDAVRNS